MTLAPRAGRDAALPGFFCAAVGEFEGVVGRVGVVSQELWFGGCGVRLRFAGSGLADVLLGALAPWGVGGRGEVGATVDVWEEVVCQAGAVAVPWVMADIGPGGFVRGRDVDRVVAVHDTFAGAVTVVDRGARAVLHRVREWVAVPWWDRAAPLRVALYWALSGPGRHFVHAGAVGDDRGGVLLAGASGSGKTTVALAALADGLGYVGDDYVLLDVGGVPRAIALYRTASIRGTQHDEPKRVVDVAGLRPGSLRASLPLRAVVVPRISGGRTEMRRLGPAATLRAIAPTTVLQFPFDDRGALGSLAGLVRLVPCFGLDVGDDVRELGGAVRRALEWGVS